MMSNFIKHIQRKVYNYLLPRLIARKCGAIVPMSGEDGYKQDCYSMYIYDEEKKETRYMISSLDMEKDEIYSLALDDKKTFSKDETLTMDYLLLNRMEVRHIYKSFWMDYNSLPSLLFNYVTRYEKFKVNLIIFKNKLFQKKFNRKKMVIHNSINVLKKILDIQLNNCGIVAYNGITCIQLMNELYTEKWVLHPEGNRKRNELQLILDSFIHSGVCEKGTAVYYYRATSKAIIAIQEYEADEDKHNDSLDVQKGIRRLTFILCLAALFQAKIFEWPTEWSFNIKNIIITTWNIICNWLS